MKVLRTAAMVVGAIALIATGVGAVVGAAAFAAATGVSLATVAAIGAVAGLVGQLTAKKPKMSVSGSPTDFKLDPHGPLPIAFGRTCSGGYVVHRDTWGEDNKRQGFVIVHSIGPIDSWVSFLSERTPVTFGGDNEANGYYNDFMWRTEQLGAKPTAAALTVPGGPMPGWTAAHKLSGLAANLVVVKFDKKGKKFARGEPKLQRVLKGVKCYDPRLDGTYPGGVGPQRWNDEATWAFSENPWIQALTFAIGWRANGILHGGVGVPLTSIVLSSFVEAANIADANGWKAGGIVTTDDEPWNVLKLLAQAGGGEPIWLAARLSAHVSAPRVSVGTIRSKDLKGSISVVGTQSRRGGRINAIIPTYRSESHAWEMVPAKVIHVPSYEVQDGGRRTVGRVYPMVQDLGQVAKLAAYDIVNGREFGPIKIPLGPEWIGLQPGMAVDLDIPEVSLDGQQAVVISRIPNFDTGVIGFELRSETAAKHAFALGATTTAPPTPSLATPEELEDDEAVDELEPETVQMIQGSTMLGAVVTITGGDVDVAAHQRVYPDKTVAVDALELNGLDLGEVYFLFYDDPARAGGAVVLQSTQVYLDAFASAANPGRHYVGRVVTGATGGDSGSGTGPTPPGGNSGSWDNPIP